LVLVTCFKFGLALKASLPKCSPPPSFKEIISIFTPQFLLSSSPKTFHSVRIYSLFLKNKFKVSHLFQIWPRPWRFLTKNLFSPSFKKLFRFFAPQFLLSSSPKTIHSVPIHSVFLKNKFLVLVTFFKFGLALKASLPKIYSSPPLSRNFFHFLHPSFHYLLLQNPFNEFKFTACSSKTNFWY